MEAGVYIMGLLRAVQAAFGEQWKDTARRTTHYSWWYKSVFWEVKVVYTVGGKQFHPTPNPTPGFANSWKILGAEDSRKSDVDVLRHRIRMK
ncbi:hypothetical protein GGS24DRAFT_98594 [Hypoxylon argillaceum]|nr:hypothetical protein GGS24DRAFT_98594 [Hypoxylon argillaceum]